MESCPPLLPSPELRPPVLQQTSQAKTHDPLLSLLAPILATKTSTDSTQNLRKEDEASHGTEDVLISSDNILTFPAHETSAAPASFDIVTSVEAENSNVSSLEVFEKHNAGGDILRPELPTSFSSDLMYDQSSQLSSESSSGLVSVFDFAQLPLTNCPFSEDGLLADEVKPVKLETDIKLEYPFYTEADPFYTEADIKLEYPFPSLSASSTQMFLWSLSQDSTLRQQIGDLSDCSFESENSAGAINDPFLNFTVPNLNNVGADSGGGDAPPGLSSGADGNENVPPGLAEGLNDEDPADYYFYGSENVPLHSSGYGDNVNIVDNDSNIMGGSASRAGVGLSEAENYKDGNENSMPEESVKNPLISFFEPYIPQSRK
jgi:hypothetical protein